MIAPSYYCEIVGPERMKCRWFDSNREKHDFEYNPKTEYPHWDGQKYEANNIITDIPT
jgi:hypothetical protein